MSLELSKPAKPKVLVVDDEPQFLDILARELGHICTVHTARSGASALDTLARDSDMAVIISDMGMPQMNGTAFLAKARTVSPNAVRLLLTGGCQLADAMGAVNEGSIFRFLAKPCDRETLRATVADAVERHRSIIEERALLEQTLQGAIKSFCDTLALVSPETYDTGVRVKRVASAVAAKVGGIEVWAVEAAAMLRQLGAMTVPAGVYERRARGERLALADRELLDRVPQITDLLLAPIPKLEVVREIVLQCRLDPGAVPNVSLGAQTLRVATDFDELESSGMTPKDAVARMRFSHQVYDPRILTSLGAIYVDPETTIAKVATSQLLEGMVLAADLVTTNGTLLVSRGQEVTAGMLRRIDNFDMPARQKMIAVFADSEGAPIRQAPKAEA